MKKNKLLIWFLIVVLLGGVLFSAFASISLLFAPEEASAEEVMSFTLSEAVEYAVKNNKSVLINKLKDTELSYSIRLAEDAVHDMDQAEKMIRAQGGSLSELYSSFEVLKVKQGYYELITNLGKNLVELSNTVSEESIRMLVENAYLNTLISKSKAENADKNLEMVKTQAGFSKTKLDLGMISELDYRGINLQLKSAEADQMNANNEYKKALMSFNELLGLKIDTSIILKTSVDAKQNEKKTDESKLLNVKKKSISLLKLKNDLEALKKEESVTRGFYGNGDRTKSVQLAIQQKEIEIQSEEIKIEKNLVGMEMDLAVMQKRLEITKENAEISNLLLGLANIRRGLGMVKEVDVIKSSVDLLTAQNQYLDLLNLYNMSITSYNNNLIN